MMATREEGYSEHPVTLTEVLERSCAADPGKIAFIFEKQRITYREFLSRVNRASCVLARLGMKKQDRAAILLYNCPEYVVSYFAVLRIGGTVIPLNFMLKEDELKYILDDAGASILITSREFAAVFERLKLRVESLKEIIVVGGKAGDKTDFSGDFSAPPGGSAGTAPCADACPGDVAAILYTSGTTGHPKGAMLTHENFISNIEASIKAAGLTGKDRFLCLLPMFHSFTWTVCVLLPIYTGATTTIVRSVKPFSEVVKKILRNRVTIFVGIPHLYNALSNAPVPRIFVSRILRIFNPLRLCISGAASLPVEVLAKFERKFRIPLLEGYGLTEASPVVSLNPQGKPKPGSVGLPVPEVEVKVADDDGNELPAGQEGELLVRGPNVMKGYYNLPEETAKTIRDGWLCTGDIAKIDSDGYIYIVDRKKDMLIVHGLNVYPREVEEVFYHNPKIAEAAVIGIKHESKGEVPKAFVVLKEGMQATAQELIRFQSEKLAFYKVCHLIEFRDSLPKTATGKILKRALRNA